MGRYAGQNYGSGSLPDVSSFSAPSSGLVIGADPLANRRMIAALGPTGALMDMQPSLGRQRIGYWSQVGGTTTMHNVGVPAPTGAGTVTLRSQATANAYQATPRIGAVSAAVAGSVAGFRNGGAQSVFGQAGHFHVMRFGISDAVIVTTGRMFAGLQGVNTVPTDVDPSTLTNIIGVGCNANDTTLQLYAAGAVAQARSQILTPTGATFPANTINTDIYELALYWPPGGASVFWELTRLNTGDNATGTLTGAQIPALTQGMFEQLWRTNGVTAAAVGIDLFTMYVETDL